ncbi:MAG: hypothetical protein ACI9FU_002148, partial [Granulosicoccus sp.]
MGRWIVAQSYFFCPLKMIGFTNVPNRFTNGRKSKHLIVEINQLFPFKVPAEFS